MMSKSQKKHLTKGTEKNDKKSLTTETKKWIEGCNAVNGVCVEFFAPFLIITHNLSI